MNVVDRMTHVVFTCRRDDTLEHAARLLWDHDCGCLPVVGEHGHLHGMITDRDICMAAYTSGRPLADLLVLESMAIDPASVRPEDSLADAELAMRHHAVHRLPVLDEQGRVIGILTSNDLLQRVDGTTDAEVAHLMTTLASIGRPRRGLPSRRCSTPPPAPAPEARPAKPAVGDPRPSPIATAAARA